MTNVQNKTTPILVIGGGPSGLAAALTLAQNGVPVRIIDKVTSFHQASRGSGLQPRTMEVFRFLGVLDDARLHARKRVQMRSYKLPGGVEPQRTWWMHEHFERTPDRPEHPQAMSQYKTEGIFRDHLAKRGVHVELGTEPISMEQDVDGVTVTVKKVASDGSETTETIRAAYVVGADGARGFTRRAIGATYEGQTKEEDGQVWADAEVEGVDSDYWHVWPQPGKFTIGIRPKGEEGKFHVGVIGQNFDPVDLVDEKKLVDFIHENTGRKDLVFKNFTSLTYWKPKMRMVNKFYEGRVFIVGDAAHVHSPSGGQGLNTSVQDSLNLCWKLALAHKGLASPILLPSYQAERLPVVTHMLIATSNLYTHLVPKKSEDVQAANANMDKNGFLQWRDLSLRMYEVNYRWSPVVFDARGTLGFDEDEMRARAYEGYPGGDVRAGDCAPDAPALLDVGGNETALFSIFKPYHHTLLVFTTEGGADVDAVVRAAQEYPEGTVRTVVIGRDGVPPTVAGAVAYHDKEGHAHRAYHVSDGPLAIFVVRPDGYVGGFAQDLEGLQSYFSRVFGRA
ncbi:FAD binding domain-containing protein [Dichomitus squalens]|uniref:FAD binding domain-containing protein n=1 Tax=Dichomitus squalens TaxID=114155 RepID=A0A4Q9PXT9_9APHY|nr:FAD binding domain-containing protein [Dichomitus squalens]